MGSEMYIRDRTTMTLLNEAPVFPMALHALRPLQNGLAPAAVELASRCLRWDPSARPSSIELARPSSNRPAPPPPDPQAVRFLFLIPICRCPPHE